MDGVLPNIPMPSRAKMIIWSELSKPCCQAQPQDAPKTGIVCGHLGVLPEDNCMYIASFACVTGDCLASALQASKAQPPDDGCAYQNGRHPSARLPCLVCLCKETCIAQSWYLAGNHKHLSTTFCAVLILPCGARTQVTGLVRTWA